MDKPFLLIIGNNYYPGDGTSDWVDCFATREEAEQFVESSGTRHEEEGEDFLVVIFKDQKGRNINCKLKEEEEKVEYFDDDSDEYYKIRNKRIYSGNSFDWYKIVDLREWAQ